jgi:hypothetical protein
MEVSADITADEIRREMQRTRSRARAEAGEVVEGARQLADWHFYPRHFPWATLGVAAALAYVAVPKRKEVVRADSDELEKLVREHKLLLEARSANEPVKKGLAATLLATAGAALMRAGMTYATHQLGQRLNAGYVHRGDLERPG